jgi:GT2 family glycosyltransferase
MTLGDTDSAVLEGAAPVTQTLAQRLADDPLAAVTVSIVLYDDASTIEAVLDGVAALEGAGELLAEVLVVDNASTDDGPERAASHRLEPRVIRRGVNDGPCGARNVGLEQALTPWVLALDGDVVPRPDCLMRMIAQAREPDVAVVMPRAVLASDPDVVHYDGGTMHYAGIMCLPHLMTRAGAGGAAHDVDAVISMALLVDRQATLDAGGWDPTFFILFEDHDVSYRLRARGLRLRFDPGTVVDHHEGTAGISFRPGATDYPKRRAYLHGRNRPYLVLKNYGLWTWIVTLPGRLLYDLAWLAFALKRGVALSWLAGRLASLRYLPRALAWRGRLTGQRRVADRDLLRADPLSVSPVAAPSGLEDRLNRILDRLLAGWWAVARILLPSSPRDPSGRR